MTGIYGLLFQELEVLHRQSETCAYAVYNLVLEKLKPAVTVIEEGICCHVFMFDANSNL